VSYSIDVSPGDRFAYRVICTSDVGGVEVRRVVAHFRDEPEAIVYARTCEKGAPRGSTHIASP
jgi:hypothetical protein